MASKSTLLYFLLIIGSAASQLIEVEKPVNNNHQPDLPGPVVPGENDEGDAIIINDSSKFPNPDGGVTESIFIPDPETDRPIGSNDNPSNGGFQIEVPEIPMETPVMPNSGGFQVVPDYDDGGPITQKYEEDNGEIPIDNWDWSRKTTKRPENKPGGFGGIWGSIVGGWHDAVNSHKEAVGNVVDSVVDVGSKYLNATKNTADKLIDAKQEVLDKVHVDGKFLNATKGVIDKIFDKKQEALNNLHTKKKGIEPTEGEQSQGDDKSDPTYTWNPPNDVAGDIFDWVDFESNNHSQEQ